MFIKQFFTPVFTQDLNARHFSQLLQSKYHFHNQSISKRPREIIISIFLEFISNSPLTKEKKM